MTWAKSLTGSVSAAARSAAEAYAGRARPATPAANDERTTIATAIAARLRVTTRPHRSISLVRCSTADRYAGNNRRACVGRQVRVRRVEARATVAPSDRASAIVRRPSSRATLLSSADERRRRSRDQIGQRVAAAARLEVALAQVQQVAARLHLAGAPQVRRIDAQARRTDSRRTRRRDRRGWRRTRAETRRAIARTRAPREAAASPGRRRASAATRAGAGAQVVGASAPSTMASVGRGVAAACDRVPHTTTSDCRRSPKIVAQVAIERA